jgi:transcriptional regulator GlxA family with amidase domain
MPPLVKPVGARRNASFSAAPAAGEAVHSSARGTASGAEFSFTCVDPRLTRVFQHVARDLSKQSTLAEVASVAGLERTYFCKYFQWSVGVSYSEWSRSIRIAHAKELLVTSISTITRIASAVGYSDVTTFERNFRRSAGLSPRQYRQREQPSRVRSKHNKRR